MNDTPLLKMEGIYKSFPGVKALDGIDFDLYPGEVHALLGENGAGKSTLIKVLGGIYSLDKGEILIEGQPATINSVSDARDNGISIIHQELVLVPQLTIAENIFLGREPRGKTGLVDYGQINRKTQEMLDSFGLPLKSGQEVAKLTIAQQQMVEVVKAISFSAKIIVMDEPTSSLADTEVESLFESIRRLKEQKIGIIYISHRMSELKQIADRVTVMRDGQYVGSRKISDTTNEELISMMVGRTMSNYYNRTYNNSEETVLKVENLSSSKVHNISFDLKKGEILGFAGLIGAGRSETMQALFGIDKITGGKVTLSGKDVTGKNVSQMIAEGVALVPEDRKGEGIFPIKDIKFNVTFKVLKKFIHGIFVNSTKEDSITDEYMRKLLIKAPNSSVLIGSLSGGNQQKVVISSWLATNPKLLILDEPTRGIDVGAKSEIYSIMNELAKQGVPIIMISSELPEVINMSDRVVVMCGGTITGVLDRTELTQEKIMQYAVKM